MRCYASVCVARLYRMAILRILLSDALRNGRRTVILKTVALNSRTPIPLSTVVIGKLQTVTTQPFRTVHDDGSNNGNRQPIMKLMNLPPINPPPNILSIFRNIGVSLDFRKLARLDPTFELESFKKNSKNFIYDISLKISKGAFDELEGLIADDSLEIIKQNYEKLTDGQKKSIALESDDRFMGWIGGVDFFEVDDKLFVEIQVCLSDFHTIVGNEMQKVDRNMIRNAYRETTQNARIVSYWFRKELLNSEDKVTADWIISKLNHTNYWDNLRV